MHQLIIEIQEYQRKNNGQKPELILMSTSLFYTLINNHMEVFGYMPENITIMGIPVKEEPLMIRKLYVII